MNARTLAAPLVALAVGLAFGYVLRGPSDDLKPERATGAATAGLPRELEERLTRIEQLLQRSSLAATEPTTRAPVDARPGEDADLVAELRALIADEHAARASTFSQNIRSEVARWRALETARPAMNTSALTALAEEWNANEGELPPRYLAYDLSDVVSEFGWPSRIEEFNGALLLVYQFDVQPHWSEDTLKRVDFRLHAGRLASFRVP